MKIQWFPGHMHSARKALHKQLDETDVAIELLDARIPGASANPMLATMVDRLPLLRVLNKSDIADDALTDRWLDFLNCQKTASAIAISASQPGSARKIAQECRKLAPHRGGPAKPLRVLICGIPNVGKSTLFNAITNRKKASTGDEPGVTKNMQRVLLDDDIYLWDTPGLMWPKVNSFETGWRLAALGAIGRNAYDSEIVASVLLEYMHANHPGVLKKRFANLDFEGVPVEGSGRHLLDAIGRLRGTIGSMRQVDMYRAAEIVLGELRGGRWGKLTLESPQDFLDRELGAQMEDRQ